MFVYVFFICYLMTVFGALAAYGIIRDMGGTIEAGNTDDGAKFTITLPAA